MSDRAGDSRSNLQGQQREARMDAALGVLRSAAMPEGLPERLLAAVREQERKHAATPRPALPPAWLWSAVAAALAMTAGLVLMHRQQAPATRQVASHRALPPAPGAQSTRGSGTSPVETRIVPVIATNSVPRPVRENRASRAAQHTTPRQEPESSAQLASFPAPPMPLTEQERLLLQIVHHGSRDELAMLDPVKRSGWLLQERRQVDQFFRETDKAKQATQGENE